ncbi:hypothetical protein IMCC21906_01069 [Spongiibacter sp. IMCC21906]|jgi:multisubunit Na+/H+ antiporter MnhB subunit|uniref:hypothetical protein n=1 Tax=Spongiibacter sp. IMCC21906 TaxID=1620392 RepID=UPI00062DF619|nr:hypothetical protein [Spongiibacter sp. IMCC21906]AKH68748.1 hypothetical protein IMCC21906_01069 [Spongiibacter sp. IMCC21906]
MSRDQDDTGKLAIGLAVVVLLAAIAIYLMLPLMAGFINAHFSPGLGMKDAAVIAFFVTVAVLVVFAIAAGDGLLGELQFMLSGFLGFFLVLWLMIAWIF